MKQPNRRWLHDLNARAVAALDEAREMPPGDERTEAMNKAMVLRNAAEIHELLCGKRGAPAKYDGRWRYLSDPAHASLMAGSL